jgi:hypothetical protein
MAPPDVIPPPDSAKEIDPSVAPEWKPFPKPRIDAGAIADGSALKFCNPFNRMERSRTRRAESAKPVRPAMQQIARAILASVFHLSESLFKLLILRNNLYIASRQGACQIGGTLLICA